MVDRIPNCVVLHSAAMAAGFCVYWNAIAEAHAAIELATDQSVRLIHYGNFSESGADQILRSLLVTARAFEAGWRQCAALPDGGK